MTALLCSAKIIIYRIAMNILSQFSNSIQVRSHTNLDRNQEGYLEIPVRCRLPQQALVQRRPQIKHP